MLVNIVAGVLWPCVDIPEAGLLLAVSPEHRPVILQLSAVCYIATKLYIKHFFCIVFLRISPINVQMTNTRFI
jgi:hypothetical protein